MRCLECGKENERGKYCNERCGNLFRVRKHRGKAPVAVEQDSFIIKSIDGPLVRTTISEDLRNTIHDPNPDWNPNKVITENNRKMVCSLCKKLSLTHGAMCFPRNGESFSVYGT